jgi:hypothetical protein
LNLGSGGLTGAVPGIGIAATAYASGNPNDQTTVYNKLFSCLAGGGTCGTIYDPPNLSFFSSAVALIEMSPNNANSYWGGVTAIAYYTVNLSCPSGGKKAR